jgi:hypothetical protein
VVLAWTICVACRHVRLDHWAFVDEHVTDGQGTSTEREGLSPSSPGRSRRAVQQEDAEGVAFRVGGVDQNPILGGR